MNYINIILRLYSLFYDKIFLYLCKNKTSNLNMKIAFLLLLGCSNVMGMNNNPFDIECAHTIGGNMIRSTCYWEAISVTGNNVNAVGEQTCKTKHVDARTCVGMLVSLDNN